MRPASSKRKRTLRGDIYFSAYGFPQLERGSEYPFEDGLALRPFCEDHPCPAQMTQDCLKTNPFLPWLGLTAPL